MIKEQLFVVHDNIKSKATEIVIEAKKSPAPNKISELFGVKEKLVSILENVRESQKEVSTTVEKIDALGAGIREANQKIANTFRTFADKEALDYSQSEKKFSKIEMVKKPWLAKKKILEAMELRRNAAMYKTENLARNVEIDRMMKKFDTLIEEAQDEKVSVMVAEQDS